MHDQINNAVSIKYFKSIKNIIS